MKVFFIGFNYTEAIPGGAWLRNSLNEVNWYSYNEIVKMQGVGWFEEQRAKQGMFTGCWIKVN